MISLLTVGTGVFASLLSAEHPSANFPLLLSSLNYMLCSTYLFRPWLRTVLCDDPSKSPSNSGDETSTLSYQNTVLGTDSVSAMDDEKYNDIRRLSQSDRTAKDGTQTVKVPSWWYVLAAFCDLEANYLIISAFNHTSYTSIAILDCFTIPSAMALSVLFLRCRYKKAHYIGTAICLSGLGFVILSDFVAESDGNAAGEEYSSSQRLEGDLMALAGAFLYACSNVLQETLLKYDVSNGWAVFDATHTVERRDAYIGSIGMYGMMIALIQGLCVEGPDLVDRLPEFSTETYLYYLGFVTSLFFFYTNTSTFSTKFIALIILIIFMSCMSDTRAQICNFTRVSNPSLSLIIFLPGTFLQMEGDAILFNLSLLTSDIYAVIFTYFNTGILVHWLYFVAFGLVGAGVVVYHAEEPPSPDFHLHQLRKQRLEQSQNYDASNTGGVDDELRSGELLGEIAHIESAFSYNPLVEDESGDESGIGPW